MRWSLVILLVVLPLVCAQEGTIPLLALVEDGTNTSGAIVDLHLEVLSGKGRVFLETIPLTKITTQISMRFAKQIACDARDASCAHYDFFYTITGFPGVVGGPSAGAAATILAVSVLENLPLDKEVAISGTINSGGIIGPVGGLVEKIEAAATGGMKTVLIPLGTRNASRGNESIDLVEHGKALGIEVIEVGTLDEVLPYFMNIDTSSPKGTVELSEKYTEAMKQVADNLCSRAFNVSAVDAENLTLRATQSYEEQQYYAAASYCFRINVLSRQQLLANSSSEDIAAGIDELTVKLEEFEQELEGQDLQTLTDLQVYMSVDERILEVYDLLEQAEQGDAEALAFARERLVSAKSWASFFGGQDNEYVIDEARLKKSCADKRLEAEERYSYLTDLLGQRVTALRDAISLSYEYADKGQYSRCLYAASKVKADIDAVLGVMNVNDPRAVLDLKLSVVNASLLRAQEEGVFPIISYNYQQYARALADDDVDSALLFAEYALEFAELDLYFDREQPTLVEEMSFEPLSSFLIGIGAGIVFSLIYFAFALKTVRRRKTLQTPRKRRSRGKKR
ncbi:hypothetical protein GF342_02870 [Candidatus Woesearchaeota archaeon]|nr:hypothetical protein [Candidatus Woesearchaeota archaeon]